MVKFIRTVVPCYIKNGRTENYVRILITYDETGRLSFRSVSEVDKQALLLDDNAVPIFGLQKEDLRTLHWFWTRWNLNDLRAGSPKQMEEIWRLRREGIQYEYKEMCEYLKTKGLYVDNGYRYGSGWIKEDVPEIVIKWLFSLPGSGDTFETIKSTFYNNIKISGEEFLSLLGVGG